MASSSSSPSRPEPLLVRIPCDAARALTQDVATSFCMGVAMGLNCNYQPFVLKSEKFGASAALLHVFVGVLLVVIRLGASSGLPERKQQRQQQPRGFA